jgi:hypothetical protein
VYLVRRYLGEGVGMFAATAVALAAVYSPRVIQEQQIKRRNRGEDGPVYPKDPARPTPPTSAAGSVRSSVSEDAARASNSDNFKVTFQE